jgi:hypothetical protein
MIRVASCIRAVATLGSSACRTLNSQSLASRAELCAYSKNFAALGPSFASNPRRYSR